MKITATKDVKLHEDLKVNLSICLLFKMCFWVVLRGYLDPFIIMAYIFVLTGDVFMDEKNVNPMWLQGH